jgi:hypothetical protein
MAMNASKKMELSQDSRRQDADIDSHYGKIGISAVAAALSYQGEQHNTTESHHTSYGRD